MSNGEAAIAALVIVAWMAFLALVFYRAGKEAKGCCFRHGHDSPRVPDPYFPGLHIRQDRLRVTRTSNPGPEVIFRSRANEGG